MPAIPVASDAVLRSAAGSRVTRKFGRPVGRHIELLRRSPWTACRIPVPHGWLTAGCLAKAVFLKPRLYVPTGHFIPARHNVPGFRTASNLHPEGMPHAHGRPPPRMRSPFRKPNAHGSIPGTTCRAWDERSRWDQEYLRRSLPAMFSHFVHRRLAKSKPYLFVPTGHFIPARHNVPGFRTASNLHPEGMPHAHGSPPSRMRSPFRKPNAHDSIPGTLCRAGMSDPVGIKIDHANHYQPATHFQPCSSSAPIRSAHLSVWV